MSANSGQKAARSRKRASVVAVLILVLLTVVSLLGLSFRIVMLPPITSLLAEQNVNDELSAFGHDELVEVAKVGRDYVDSVPGATMPAGDDERTSFTPDVISHMEDVRVVIQVAFYVTLAICVAFLIALIVVGRRFGRRTVGNSLFAGGIVTVSLVVVLGVIGALNFDALFTAMHKLLFADGTWTFSADSLLICAYPIGFWIGMAVVWASALLALSVLASVTGFLLRRTR